MLFDIYVIYMNIYIMNREEILKEIRKYTRMGFYLNGRVLT